MEEIYKTYLQALPYFVCLDGYFEITEWTVGLGFQVLSETNFYPCFYLVYLRIFGLTGRLKAIIVVLKPRETVKSNKDIVTYKIVVLRWAYWFKRFLRRQWEAILKFQICSSLHSVCLTVWLHWAWHDNQSRKLLVPLANVLGVKWWQVMVLQVPDKSREPLSTEVENYFRMNHPDYYLTHQVRAIISYGNLIFTATIEDKIALNREALFQIFSNLLIHNIERITLSFNIKNQAMSLTPGLWRIESKHASHSLI